jgi:hypothetical protein
MMNGTILTNIMFALLTLVMPLTLKSSYKEMTGIISKYNKYFSEKALKRTSYVGIFFIIVVFLLWLAFLFGLKISYHIPFMGYLLTHSYFAGVSFLVCDVASALRECEESYDSSEEERENEQEKVAKNADATK